MKKQQTTPRTPPPKGMWTKLSNAQKITTAIVALGVAITTTAAAVNLMHGWTRDALGDPPWSNLEQTEKQFNDVAEEVGNVSYIVAGLQQDGVLKKLSQIQFQILQLEDERGKNKQKFERWKNDLLDKLRDDRRTLQKALEVIEETEKPVVRQWVPRTKVAPNSPTAPKR